eukprot:10728176-Lingulodinium_polyedra.AAC.1
MRCISPWAIGFCFWVTGTVPVLASPPRATRGVWSSCARRRRVPRRPGRSSGWPSGTFPQTQ